MIPPNLEACSWECKDYADGWIKFQTLNEAIEYQIETGCLVRVVYREKKSVA